MDELQVPDAEVARAVSAAEDLDREITDSSLVGPIGIQDLMETVDTEAIMDTAEVVCELWHSEATPLAAAI